jgi:uncharacterized protein (TIGR00369 family)
LSFDPSEVTEGTYPALLGIEFDDVGEGAAVGRLAIGPRLLAPNGYLHAGAVVSLADTVCGFGCVGSLPEGAHGFTTIELKTNFLGTAREGEIVCRGALVHGGRTTQVWDAVVEDGTGKTVALFRCTQLLLR